MEQKGVNNVNNLSAYTNKDKVHLHKYWRKPSLFHKEDNRKQTNTGRSCKDTQNQASIINPAKESLWQNLKKKLISHLSDRFFIFYLLPLILLPSSFSIFHSSKHERINEIPSTSIDKVVIIQDLDSFEIICDEISIYIQMQSSSLIKNLFPYVLSYIAYM